MFDRIAQARSDTDGIFPDAKLLGKEGDQALIGFALFRWGGHLDLNHITKDADERCLAAAGHDLGDKRDALLVFLDGRRRRGHLFDVLSQIGADRQLDVFLDLFGQLAEDG